MCIAPPQVPPLYVNAGSTPLVMTNAGWSAADAALPNAPGLSTLVAFPPGTQPGMGAGRIVIVSGSRAQGAGGMSGLRRRWGDPGNGGHRHSWAQANQDFPQWCCMFAQLTSMAGQPLPAPAQHPACLAAAAGGGWTYQINWWTCAWGQAPNDIRPHTNDMVDAQGLGGVAIPAVRKHPNGGPPPFNVLARVNNTPPCGC